MRYTVGTQPQPLYPDGFQEALSIYNNGPWTVFLDSDSSINESSYPLPPTGTIVWDAQRPLWARSSLGAQSFTLAGDPNANPSTLTVTRNADQGIAPRAATVDPLFARSTVDLSGGATYTFPTLETASYNTLFIQYNSPEIGAPTPSDHEFIVDIAWTDELGQVVGSNRYISPGTSAPNPARGVVLTIPVRGARADITFTYVDPSPPATATFSFKAFASSRVLRDRQDWLSVSSTSFRTAFSTAVGPDQESYDGYYKMTGWEADFDPIYLNGIGNDLQVSFRIGPVSTAGRLFVRSYYDNNAIFADIAIPVSASAATLVETLYVPISTPVQIILSPAPVHSGTANIALVWKDYNYDG